MGRRALAVRGLVFDPDQQGDRDHRMPHFVVSQCAAGVQLSAGSWSLPARAAPLSQINTQPINANTQNRFRPGLPGRLSHAVPCRGYRSACRSPTIPISKPRRHRASTFEYAGSVGQIRRSAAFRNSSATVAATYGGAVAGHGAGRLSARPSSTTPGARLMWTTITSRRSPIWICAAPIRWTANIQLYAAIDNVFNTPPPVVPATTNSSTPYDASVRDDIYDAIGRQYRVGVRFNY